ncbi:hypothetical protein ACJQWK_09950 [Exserohilum turcicum]
MTDLWDTRIEIGILDMSNTKAMAAVSTAATSPTITSTSPSDTHSIASSLSSSKTLVAKIWRKNPSSPSSSSTAAARIQAKAAEKETRAAARATYFSMM